MRTLLSLLLLPILLISQELEVRLQTRSPLKPVYLSRLAAPQGQTDWRYYDEVRSLLEFDFGANGFFSVVETKDDLEDALRLPDARSRFDVSLWRKEKTSYVFALQATQNKLSLTAYNIEKGTSKKYPDVPLSGRLENDRGALHRLADAVQKDLVGIEGISSLRLIYVNRLKNPDPKGPEWLSEVWLCDSDGAAPRQVTRENSYCISPSFLPQSSSIDPEFFYVSYKTGQPKIYRASLSQPKGEPMVSLRGNQALPALSRKGTQLAFISDVAGRPDLFLQTLDAGGRMVGKARQLYSSPRATQASPTFSPDGKQVAFVSDKDGPPRVYLLDVLGPKETKRAHPRLLTKKNRENTAPSWSPDGKRIAYSAKVDGVRQIYIYDLAADEEIQLTTGSENKENPAWAPDSLHLVYNTESEDICELYLLHINDPQPILLTKGPGQKRFPSWEPR